MTTEYRIQQLELGYDELRDRVVELEQRSVGHDAPARPQDPIPVARPAQQAPAPVRDVRPPAPEPRPRRVREPRKSPAINFEDLLGGRILALIGAVAVVLAGAFFFALAVSNGWIGEAARTVLAAIGSTGLLAFGVWLHERKGRTYASLSVAGAALACLFLTVTVAAEVYDLIPAAVALALAMLIGACGTVLAVRWSAVPIGAIGIVGALLSPVLAGAPQTGTTLALLFVANAAAVAVLLWQRWDWLGFATFVVAGPQWVDWLGTSASTAGSLLALVGFGALGVGTAIGFELRVPMARLRASSALLLALNALVLALAGWFALDGQSHRDLAEMWLCFLAVAHLGVGVASYRLERISRDVGLLVLVIGVLLADIAFSLTVGGVAQAIGYAAAAVLFAWLLRGVEKGGLPETLVSIGLGGHVLYAMVHLLAVEAPPAALLGDPVDLLTAVFGLASLSGALFWAARLSADRQEWRVPLDSTALAVVAYTAALVLDGAALVAFLAVGAVVLAQLARRTGDMVLSVASVAYLGTGLLHALAIEAPTEAIDHGAEAVIDAVVALGSCGLAAFAAARLFADREEPWRDVLDSVGLAVGAYLAAVALDGALLVAALAVGAVVLAALARRTGDMVLSVASVLYLGTGALHALAIEATPEALIYGAESAVQAAVALGACGLAALACAHLRLGDRTWQLGLWFGGAITLLYLASVAIVTVFQPGGAETMLLELPVRQQGQVLVSALWGVVGLFALLVGLRNDMRALRMGALSLLLAAVAKVFLYDLATLGSVYRAASFLALGALLLAASFAYQRLRPTPLPDLREVSRALR